MAGVTIRPALAGDIPDITRIYAHAVLTGTATFELEPPDAAEMARRHASLTGDGYPYLVATVEGRLAGYAYAGPYRARPAYYWSVEDSIYVDPSVQRRGVGRALMEALIVASEKRGFRQLIAVIGDSAQIASIALHRATGFKLIGTMENVGFKFGRWLDTVMMQRALGSGASTPPADSASVHHAQRAVEDT